MRCAICNYNDDDGSDLLDIAPQNGIKVNWSEQHQEFQCSMCTAEIEDYDEASDLPDDQTII